MPGLSQWSLISAKWETKQTRVDSSLHRTYLSNENKEGARKRSADLGFVAAYEGAGYKKKDVQ
jgi:hypothetical protein